MTRRFEAVVQRAVEETERRTHTDGRTIYRAVATTPALDRYGEVVLPKGAVLDNFLKNPVLLDSHNYTVSSVGHVVNLTVEETQMTFDFVFSADTRGQELEQKFVAGDMNAFSIGFKPKAKLDLWTPWDDMPEVKEVKVEYPDGSQGVVDLTSYEHVPYRIYNKWELLEISPVAVPANPEALLMRQAEEIIRRSMENTPEYMRSFIQEEVANRFAPVIELLSEFTDSFDADVIKFEGAVPSHSTPIEEGKWSGSAARTALAKWASKGGSGKKEDMNWAKYSKGFAWFDSKQADSLGAYKLPHHTVKDGALIAVWNGVTAAMAALLGARGGVDLDSKEAVYRHLARHYKDFEKEPPEMKDYSDEELQAIADEPLVVKADPPPADNSEVIEGQAPITKADGEDGDGEDGDEDGMPNMTDMMATLNKILALVEKLAGSNSESAESQEEHFVELHLKTEAIQDLLEYAVQKKAMPEKKIEEKKVVGEVSGDLIASLERVTL